MTDTRMKIPDANHPIAIEPSGKRIRVMWQGKVVAASSQTLAMKETTHPIVHYIPRADVDMKLLRKTAHATYCPYKGEASYYSLAAEGAESAEAENAVWSYEDPYPAMAPIREYLAFYPNQVEIEEA